jgi:hypothetical protein
MNKELGMMLGGFSPQVFIGLKTADPAAWQDWIDAVNKVTKNKYITEAEAKKAMIILLK